ncbi:AraC family transcriptional regulator [Micromonospora thermarum]|uniref:Helix-turn-helix transcriptional regulator n=1 Tax=Micromonospora thermarum TaxID=2720024 RepID=A0ABX0Z9X9_9ACTN|nr:helix-turn-helix transcriptional regulator [Micromonospora thermarum]
MGFTDPAHFSRAFRAAYGMSPAAYRERHDPSAAEGSRSRQTRSDTAEPEGPC